jgi:hypothetical protein
MAYFERGGLRRHGPEYRARLQRRGLLANALVNPEGLANSPEGGSKSGASQPKAVATDDGFAPRCTELHPAVARMSDAWPNLPPHIQEAVLTLVECTVPPIPLED